MTSQEKTIKAIHELTKRNGHGLTDQDIRREIKKLTAEEIRKKEPLTLASDSESEELRYAVSGLDRFESHFRDLLKFELPDELKKHLKTIEPHVKAIRKVLKKIK